VQTAINSASAGDTVVVPAGNCTWTTGVNIDSKSLTLQGAGIDVTNITDSTPGDTGAVGVSGVTASNFVTVTGFTFIKSSNITDGMVQIYGASNHGQRDVGFRFHHNRLLIGSSGGRGISVFSIWGLIDHNTFDITDTSGSDQSISLYGASIGSDGGFTPWAYPMELGTNHSVYVEDNTFNYANQNEDSIDGYTGARAVIRHNTFNNISHGFHGTDSGNNRSLFSWEIYSNNYVNNSSTILRGATFRGGSGIIFGNTYSGSRGQWYGYTAMEYRATVGPQSKWGSCDGTNWQIGSTDYSANGSRAVSQYTGTLADPLSPLDSTHVSFCKINRDQVCTADSTCSAMSAGDTCTTFFDGSGPSAYPCRDQPGRTHNQALAPIYAWLNTGTNAPSAGSYNGGGSISETTWMLENRDYYNYTGSFNGTVGVGSGVLASRPTTCTTTSEAGGGVAYWATDTNTLYRCSAANTWTPYYTPYTYPHPLQGSQGGSAPAAPTSVHFTSVK
jgi:hypothetical protein